MTAHHDIIIRGGMIVDGTGTEPFRADIAIADGIIVAVGTVTGSASEEIDADRPADHAGLYRPAHPL